jgi:hypothetical protein
MQERNQGGLAPAPLQDMSPNVPLLSLSQYPSPGSKLIGSPNVARRLSFSAAVPAATAGFSLQGFTTSTSYNNDDGISPLLARIAPPPGCPWLAEFGELADLSKLGSLPSEDDILLKFAVEHTREDVLAGGGDFLKQDHYLQQPHSYFQLQHQSNGHQHQQAQMWVPQQSFEADFTGAPTPLLTPVDDRLLPYHHQQQQHQQHPYQLHSGRQGDRTYPPSSSSSFYLSGNAPPGSTSTDYYSRAKRRADRELRPVGAVPPPSSVASGSRAQNNSIKQQRQHGTYSGYQTSISLKFQQQQQQQPSRSTKNNTTTAGNRNFQLVAIPDDFESDDPGANTGKSYRGVSRHRLTQRWEASLWLNGRQLYLGGFDAQIDAAKAYDLAALACKGLDAIINFSAEEYDDQLREIAGFSREEVVAYVRRRSAAFSRGKSKYRGVSGHNGRWEARIGSFNGRKNVSSYLKCTKCIQFLNHRNFYCARSEVWR